jgi:hypothetical protein
MLGTLKRHEAENTEYKEKQNKLASHRIICM